MKRDKFDDFLEKYRFFVGGGLLFAILLGCGVLFWRENYQKPNVESRASNIEKKIEVLESRISELETRNTELPINTSQIDSNGSKQSDQIANSEPIVSNSNDSGSVEGASTQDVGILKQDPKGSLQGAQRAPFGIQDESKNSNAKPAGKINLNTATAAQLDSLPGIGPAYAGRIIEYRNQNGGFKSIEEVKNVKGIGEKTFEKFKELISL